MQPDLFAISEDDSASLLAGLLRSADTVLVKKLSNNDRDWARFENKHQGGVYIPPAQRDGGFFPELAVKQRGDPDTAEIRECFFTTQWPQTGDTKRTRLVHYTSKGPETHMTGVPKEAFATLSPASFLVMGKYGFGAEAGYRCLTIDSASDDAMLLADALELDADFLIDVRVPGDLRTAERDRILDFAEQVAAAWLSGRIVQFAADNASMPSTAALAQMARQQYLDLHRLDRLDPLLLEAPGDAVREISRNIEWDMFREYQRREKAVALVRAVLGDKPAEAGMAGMIRALVDAIGDIDRLMLSASQQRKSRAGYSFEFQIEALLMAGKIPFEKQVVMDAKKRPDFVLPSLAHFVKVPEGKAPGLILSAKTTLRERWKQVQREMGDGDLFLATVDENIAANAIEDMAALGIRLVVPEALKSSKDTEYVRHGNVMTFREMFSGELRKARLPRW